MSQRIFVHKLNDFSKYFFSAAKTYDKEIRPCNISSECTYNDDIIFHLDFIFFFHSSIFLCRRKHICIGNHRKRFIQFLSYCFGVFSNKNKINRRERNVFYLIILWSVAGEVRSDLSSCNRFRRI